MFKYWKLEGKFIKANLYASKKYWGLTSKQVKEMFNGIGPESWFVNFVPKAWRNSIYGAYFGEIGYIHDCRYKNKPNVSEEKLKEYKLQSDKELLKNGFIIAEYHFNNSSWFNKISGFRYILLKLRKKRLKYYYKLCRKYGEEYFLTNKGD